MIQMLGLLQILELIHLFGSIQCLPDLFPRIGYMFLEGEDLGQGSIPEVFWKKRL